ncbi:helix-turn-helix domain-containing protein [Actinoplanes sp. RD1]|uniref:hypothetical protein n=1 Tax=Actinoplanes sp. RD1 TaxID=3064538 RepID=UPI0027403AE8|nr:hypothetical protein [Actinoplanes sp. RD1]
MSLSGGNVAIICAQPIARAGLEQLVRECPGLLITTSIRTSEELFQSELDDACRVIVVDLPTVGPHQAAAELIGKLATIGDPVVVVPWPEPPTPLAAIRAGARGVISRYTEAAEVRRAISTVNDGGISVAPELSARLWDELGLPTAAMS